MRTLFSTFAVIAATSLTLISCQPAPVVGPGAGDSTASTPTPLPKDLHPNLAAAFDAIQANDLEKAAGLLGGVPAEDPGHSLALQNLGFVQYQLGQPQESLETYNRLRPLQPEEAHTHIGLSWALFGLRRYDEAEHAGLRALELDPNNLAARYNVALFRVARGRIEDAILSYRRAMRRDSTNKHLAAGQTDLKRLEQLEPELAEVHYALAFFANSTGARQQEMDELEIFLKMEPTGPAADQARANFERMQEGAGPKIE